MQEQWYSLDIETSGKYPSNARLLSLALIGCMIEDNARIEAPYTHYDFYFNQMMETPSEAAQLHGLTRSVLKELSGGLSLEDQYDSISPFLNTKINVIGHNVKNFDLKTITNSVAQLGRPIPVFGKIIDTLPMARAYWPKGTLLNHKLGTCFAEVLRVTNTTQEQHLQIYRAITKRPAMEAVAHDAGWDAYMCMRVAKFLLTK